MPLTGVSTEVARRFATLNAYIGWLDSQEQLHTPPAPPLPTYVKACKGLVFIHLYAIWEYTLNNIGVAANQYITNQNIKKQDVAIPILPLVAASKLASLRDCPLGDAWRQSSEFFAEAFQSDVVEIQDSIFPKDGSHYRFQQLETLCHHFCVTASPDTNPSMRWIVNETVTHRNNIAHGTTAPEDVGGRFPMRELKRRVAGLNTLISHAVNVITAQLTAQKGLLR